MGGFQRQPQLSPRSKAGQKWLSKVKKGSQVAPKESVAMSMVHMSPMGSQLSFAIQNTRIEHVTDWAAIAKKYRALVGHLDEIKENTGSSEDDDNEEIELQIPNNITAAHSNNP